MYKWNGVVISHLGIYALLSHSWSTEWKYSIFSVVTYPYSPPLLYLTLMAIFRIVNFCTTYSCWFHFIHPQGLHSHRLIFLLFFHHFYHFYGYVTHTPGSVWTGSPKFTWSTFVSPCRPWYVSTGLVCKIKYHLFNLPTSLKNLLGIY